ncbi:MAG: hypothetical protein U0798_04945 [Gemmataceae bacterium]
MKPTLIAMVLGIMTPLAGLSALRAQSTDLDRPPILYSTATPHNVVTELEKKLKDQKLVIEPDPEFGYLKPLLKALDVPISSQVMVFSKTSLQRSRIGPKTPRAMYFNDDISIGFCRHGEVLEVAAADPKLGTVFYSVDQRPNKKLTFTRQTESCLICHGSSSNQGFPGFLVRSVFPDRAGDPVLSKGTKRVDHSTPLEDRWGGWYVTGTSGKQTHQGNQIVGGWSWADADRQPASENITDLKPYFTIGNYLSPHSDIVALMVLEHQGEMYNRLTRANFQTRIALFEQEELNKAFNEPMKNRSEGITKRIHWACEPVVQFMLFSEETKLTEPVVGTSGFTEEFAARGPFDSKKRSLRQFDLKTRMFRYPMSYMIYSSLFEGLPAEAKARIYQRLWEVLSGKDQSKEFAHLTKADRENIIAILRETKKDLPDYWKKD